MSENVNSIVAVATIHGKKIYLSGDITDDEEKATLMGNLCMVIYDIITDILIK